MGKIRTWLLQRLIGKSPVIANVKIVGSVSAKDGTDAVHAVAPISLHGDGASFLTGPYHRAE